MSICNVRLLILPLTSNIFCMFFYVRCCGEIHPSSTLKLYATLWFLPWEVTSSASQQVNKHTGRVGFCKSPCEDARASRNLGGPRKAVVAEVKCESLNGEENCCVWEGAGKLTGSVNQEAACPRQHKSTADGRKAHTPPPREWRVPGRCELHRSSAVPPIGQSYRRGRTTAAEQSRTQQKDKRRSTRAGTEKRRSSHPYESSHWVKKQWGP